MFIECQQITSPCLNCVDSWHHRQPWRAVATKWTSAVAGKLLIVFITVCKQPPCTWIWNVLVMRSGTRGCERASFDTVYPLPCRTILSLSLSLFLFLSLSPSLSFTCTCMHACKHTHTHTHAHTRARAQTRTQSIGLLEKMCFKWWFEGWEGVGWPDFVRESVPYRRRSIRKWPLTKRVCAYRGKTENGSIRRMLMHAPYHRVATPKNPCGGRQRMQKITAPLLRP